MHVDQCNGGSRVPCFVLGIRFASIRDCFANVRFKFLSQHRYSSSGNRASERLTTIFHASGGITWVGSIFRYFKKAKGLTS